VVPYGDRSILVCTVPHPLGKEHVARNLIEKLEDLQVIDSPTPDILDKPTPVSGKAMIP